MHASLTFGAAFVGGLASFLSPCVLPLLPTLLLLLTGSGTGRKSQLGVNLTAFLLGFAVVFMALGAASTLVGRLLLGHLAFWEKLGGILLVLLGLFLSGLWQPLFLVRDRRPFLQTQAKGPLGCFLLGLSFTLGWTPCTGPILAAILLLAGHEATVGAGLLLGVWVLPCLFSCWPWSGTKWLPESGPCTGTCHFYKRRRESSFWCWGLPCFLGMPCGLTLFFFAFRPAPWYNRGAKRRKW